MPQPIDSSSYRSPQSQRPAVPLPIERDPRAHDPSPAFRFDDTSIPLIYLLLFIGATARTFSWAARSSFFPTLVPRDVFANAVTWNNSIFQIGSVVGPALSGLLVAYVGFPFVYLLDALCAFAFFLLVVPIRRSKQRRDQIEASTWKSLMAGLRFVFRRKV